MNLCGSLNRIRHIARYYRGSTLASSAAAAEKTPETGKRIFTDDQIDALLDQLFDPAQHGVALFQKAQFKQVDTAGILDRALLEPFKVATTFNMSSKQCAAKYNDYALASGFSMVQLDGVAGASELPMLDRSEPANDNSLTYIKGSSTGHVNMLANSKLNTTLPMWRFERDSTTVATKSRTEYQAEIELLLKQCAIYVNDLAPLLNFPTLQLNQYNQRNARQWQGEWIAWWHRILSEVIMVAEDRQGGDPSFDLIHDRAVQFKLFDHAVDGNALPHLDYSRLADYAQFLGPIIDVNGEAKVEFTPPNQMFVDEHLGLLNDYNLRSASARMAKCDRAPCGLVYLTHALGANIFSPISFLLDQQATFIVVYETPGDAQHAIDNAPDDFGALLEPSLYHEKEYHSSLSQVAKYFDQLGFEVASTIDDARFAPGKTRSTAKLLTEKDWRRHLRRRDILRLADAEQRKDGFIEEDKIHSQFYLQRFGGLQYDQIDLDRPHRTEFFIDKVSSNLNVPNA